MSDPNDEFEIWGVPGAWRLLERTGEDSAMYVRDSGNRPIYCGALDGEVRKIPKAKR